MHQEANKAVKKCLSIAVNNDFFAMVAYIIHFINVSKMLRQQ